MTKATGRGRDWRRKGTWSDLAPSTRKRYERLGVTKASYERGNTSAYKRGKDWEAFLGRQEKYYNLTPDVVKEQLEGYDRKRLIDAAERQRQMIDAYHAGDLKRAQRLWAQRDRSLPEWMFYYHGMFS